MGNAERKGADCLGGVIIATFLWQSVICGLLKNYCEALSFIFTFYLNIYSGLEYLSNFSFAGAMEGFDEVLDTS